MRAQPAYVTGPMASYNQIRKAKEAAARAEMRRLAIQLMLWTVGIGTLMTALSFVSLFSLG